jgi:hypothetical protein
MTGLKFLNVFFFCFHAAVILFNLFGWIWKRTRKLHLISIGITAFSWFALGAFYGWGYCFLTDWHYEVRHQLGLPVDSNSYIHFMLLRSGYEPWSAKTTDIITVTLFVSCMLAAILVNSSFRKLFKS